MTESEFVAHLRSLNGARILEIGTKRANPEIASHHKAWAPRADWVLSDFQEGLDVDVVVDAQKS